jgi:WD40 repeat protein
MGQSFSVSATEGISYEAFHAYTVSTEIPTHLVDVKATFERYKDRNSNLIPSETIRELSLKADIFLTHDWGIDEMGRLNHDRVAAINRELKSLGFVTWFDSDRMTGDVVDQMVSGIDNASVIIVFVTQRYMNKVNGSKANDNCRKEFKYATQRKSSTKMIPVVMEPRMKDISVNWSGTLQMELGTILYVDFSNDNCFQSAIQQLKAEILIRTTPLWVMKGRPPTPVIELAYSPPPPPSSALDDADLQMVGELKSWFVGLKISSSMSRMYAEVLVEKNTGSITKLQRKLEKNPHYLEEIGGFDEDDIIDIKEGFKLFPSLNIDSSWSEKEREPPRSIIPVESKQVIRFNEHELVDRFTIPKPIVVDSQQTKRKDSISPTTPLTPPIAVSPFRSRISSESHSELVCSLSWDPVSDRIASGSYDNTIKIWDGKSLKLFKTFEGHSDSVLSVSWNQDGTKIVSGSVDTTIKIWDSSTGIVLHTLEGHSSLVLSVAWSHDDSKIVSGSWDNTIKVWGWTKSFLLGHGVTWKLLKTLEGHSDCVLSVAWNHDSSKIISGSGDKTIKIWDSYSGSVLRSLAGHSDGVTSVSWSHDGTKILSGSSDQSVKIWNSTTGVLLTTFDDFEKEVECVAWSPDGQKIAACSPDEDRIVVWDVLTGQVVKTIPVADKVFSLAWSSDSTELMCSVFRKLKVYPLL